MKTNDGVSFFFFFFSFLSDRDDLSIPGFEEAGNLKIIIFIARWIKFSFEFNESNLAKNLFKIGGKCVVRYNRFILREKSATRKCHVSDSRDHADFL